MYVGVCMYVGMYNYVQLSEKILRFEYPHRKASQQISIK